MRIEVLIPHPVDEKFKEPDNKYFELEPIFDTSDIKENYDRLDFGPKFDVYDVEDGDEFDEHKKKKIESCRDFILIDEEVNNEELEILSTHSNKESIQEYL